MHEATLPLGMIWGQKEPNKEWIKEMHKGLIKPRMGSQTSYTPLHMHFPHGPSKSALYETWGSPLCRKKNNFPFPKESSSQLPRQVRFTPPRPKKSVTWVPYHPKFEIFTKQSTSLKFYYQHSRVKLAKRNHPRSEQGISQSPRLLRATNQLKVIMRVK